jgi:hypothetical protein
MDKRSLSERDICTKFITPALRQAGWDEMLQVREEVSFTKGRIIVRGKLVSRGKGKRADYILYFKPRVRARASKGPAYCMAATDPTAPCAPPKEAYELDRDGKPILDRDGQPRVDVRKTDPRAPHVGTWAKPGEAPVIGTQETSTFMITVSKVPGMNAMALLHDDLSYQMAFDPATNVWTIVPASVVTYYGTGVPTENQIRETAEDSKTTKAN